MRAVIFTLSLSLYFSIQPAFAQKTCLEVFGGERNPILTERDRKFPFTEFMKTDKVKLVQQAYSDVESTVERVTRSPEPANFANTADPVLNAIAKFDQIALSLYNLPYVVTDKNLSQADSLAQQLNVKVAQLRFLNSALHRKLKIALESDRELSDDQRFILKDWIKKGEIQGVALSPEKKQRLSEVDSRLVILSQKYQDIYTAAENAIVYLPANTRFDEGISQALLSDAKSLAKSQRRSGYAFKFKMEGIDQFKSVLMYASDPVVRKTFYEKFVHRLKQPQLDTTEIVREMANLRLEKAQILGYKNFAELALLPTMVKTPDKLATFINETKSEFIQMAKHELSEVTSYKLKQTGVIKLQPWDVQYYARLQEAEKFKWNSEEARPYFEFNETLQRIMKTLGRIYTIEFVRDPEIEVWHHDVIAYRVVDLQNSDHRVLGYVYLDLFAREGKKATTNFAGELVPGGYYDGTYLSEKIAAVMPLVKNENGPTFLTVANLVSIFHEMGHLIHTLSYNRGYPVYRSFQTPTDFVELPSQVLENWIFEPEVLKSLSSHYETREPLPDAWIEKIQAMRSSLSGLKSFARRNLMTDLDYKIHTITEPISDMAAFERDTLSSWKELPYLVDVAGSYNYFRYIFMHGYEARFHGYQWGEVLDTDAFEYFKETDIFDAEKGLRFRNDVLAKGALMDAEASYQEFRGRPADPKAILRKGQ